MYTYVYNEDKYAWQIYQHNRKRPTALSASLSYLPFWGPYFYPRTRFSKSVYRGPCIYLYLYTCVNLYMYIIRVCVCVYIYIYGYMCVYTHTYNIFSLKWDREANRTHTATHCNTLQQAHSVISYIPFGDLYRYSTFIYMCVYICIYENINTCAIRPGVFVDKYVCMCK